MKIRVIRKGTTLSRDLLQHGK